MNAAKDNMKIQQAEDMVTDSIAKLEHVMEELTVKVEDSSHKIQHVMELGLRQKDELIHLKERAEATVLPVIRQGLDASRGLTAKVRANRDPLAIGFVALAVSWLAYRLFSRNTQSRSF